LSSQLKDSIKLNRHRKARKEGFIDFRSFCFEAAREKFYEIRCDSNGESSTVSAKAMCVKVEKLTGEVGEKVTWAMSSL
jgi:hypothetical protein